MTSWANYRVYGRVGFAVKVDDVGRRLVSLASDKMRPTSFGTVSTETTEKRGVKTEAAALTELLTKIEFPDSMIGLTVFSRRFISLTDKTNFVDRRF